MQYLVLLLSSALLTLAIQTYIERDALLEADKSLQARHTVQRLRAELIENRLDKAEEQILWLQDVVQAIEARGRK